jgi:hypothetical protein
MLVIYYVQCCEKVIQIVASGTDCADSMGSIPDHQFLPPLHLDHWSMDYLHIADIECTTCLRSWIYGKLFVLQSWWAEEEGTSLLPPEYDG